MKAVFVSLMLLATSLARAGFQECYRATCRVHAQGGAGTGCVYHADDSYYYVLTNAHVAGSQTGAEMTCIFNHEGYEQTTKGTVCWTTGTPGTRDQAVIAIPVSQFNGFKPQIVPLASRDYRIQPGDTVMSVGCAKAAWSTAWVGHVLTNDGRTMDFTPTPAPGRSGSAIFDRNGSQIIGLVTWSTNGGGRAQTVQEIHSAIAGEQVSEPILLAPLTDIKPLQSCPTCPQGGQMRPFSGVQACPDGNCPQPGGGSAQPPSGGFNPFPQAPAEPAPSNPPPQPPTSEPGCKCDGSGKCECGPQKPCECDNSKILEALDKMADRQAALEQAVAELAKRPIPKTDDEILAGILEKLPPITIQTLDDDGNVRDQDVVYLGGTLGLRLHPIGPSTTAAK